MTLQLTSSIRWIPGIIHRARSDSLIRNSFYLMTSTVVNAGLGYIFWVIAAHVYPHQAISGGSAVISNVAVAVFRVTQRVGYSSVLNLGILTITLVGEWMLMPLVGIVGADLAWLGVQRLGAIASLPAFTHSRGLMIL